MMGLFERGMRWRYINCRQPEISRLAADEGFIADVTGKTGADCEKD